VSSLPKPDEGMISRLWAFIVERQEVRYRRHVLHQKPPWTDDPVLQANHFTNIYREDDPGTIYAVENILRERPLSIRVWNTVWYRMFGKEETWEAFKAAHVVPEASRYSVGCMEEVMREMVAQGRSPFTSAYLVSNHGRSEDKVTVMVDTMLRAVEDWHAMLERLTQAAFHEQDRQAAHAALESLFGVGRFIAFQALVDLSYPVMQGEGFRDRRNLPLDNDGWATCGPGAERGLKLVLPGIKRAQWNDGLAYLVDRSHTELALRGFMFRKREDGSEQPLDRANMCNCLCEFDKYVRLSAGEGKGRRRPFSAIESYKRDREARGHGYQYDIELDGLAQREPMQ